jgi:hypothetical protein
MVVTCFVKEIQISSKLRRMEQIGLLPFLYPRHKLRMILLSRGNLRLLRNYWKSSQEQMKENLR